MRGDADSEGEDEVDADRSGDTERNELRDIDSEASGDEDGDAVIVWGFVTTGVVVALRVTAAIVGDKIADTVRDCVAAGESVGRPEEDTSVVGPAEVDASFVNEDERVNPRLLLPVADSEFCMLTEEDPHTVALDDIEARLAVTTAVADGFEGEALDVPDTEGDAV